MYINIEARRCIMVTGMTLERILSKNLILFLKLSGHVVIYYICTVRVRGGGLKSTKERHERVNKMTGRSCWLRSAIGL